MNHTTNRNNGEAVYTIRSLTKVYDMGEVKVHALRGIDLDVSDGEFIVLLGPSGSGKSTLLNIIGGLDVQTAGTLLYRGEPLHLDNDTDMTAYRRNNIGFVFQFYNLVPSLTACENVAMVTDLVDGSMTPEQALSVVGLQDRLNHFPAQLSGGEQQRVAIARAIAKNPDVLLCDEPTGALDVKTGVRVLEAIATANNEGMTTMVITHNSDIARMADRVFHLSDGHIVETIVNKEKQDPADINW
jgi:putative ABC transport system ATP-binding protein